MGKTDLSIRQTAIPLTFPAWGYNRNEKSDQDVSYSRAPGDLLNLVGQGGANQVVAPGTPLIRNGVRIVRPYYGPIVKAHLTLRLRVSASEPSPLQLWIGRGQFDSSTGIGTVSDDQIKLDHQRIVGGTGAPFSAAPGGIIDINGLDITSLIANSTAASETSPYSEQYRNYGFVLMFLFNRQPVNSGAYRLLKFSVTGSAQSVGVV